MKDKKTSSSTARFLAKEYAQRFREELLLVESQEWFLIKLESHLFDIDKQGDLTERGLGKRAARLFLRQVEADIAPFLLGINWGQVVGNPRFRMVNQFLKVLDAIREKYFSKVAPRRLPWRKSTYDHLRPSDAYMRALEEERKSEEREEREVAEYPHSRPTPAYVERGRPRRVPKAAVAALCLIIVVIAAAWLYDMGILPLPPITAPQPPQQQPLPQSKSPTPTSSTPPPSETSSIEEFRKEAVILALSKINAARKEAGFPPVFLVNSSIAAQYRAEYMKKNNYFGHYDLHGFHPGYYYTKLGGLYAMEESCGYCYYSALASYDVPAKVEDLVYDFIYNDVASSWGHRDSLLDPTNN